MLVFVLGEIIQRRQNMLTDKSDHAIRKRQIGDSNHLFLINIFLIFSLGVCLDGKLRKSSQGFYRSD